VGTIAFLDESADPSYNLEAGASPQFVVALVVFTDPAEAARCSERVTRLRAELGKTEWYEFHMRDNAHVDRIAFLAAVSSFAFAYHVAVLEKDPLHPVAEPLLLVGCARVCTAAGISRTLLVVDGQSGRRRNRALIAALRTTISAACGHDALDGVQVQDSARTPLLQLADYVAGAISRDALGRPGGKEYRRMLRAREGTYWRGPA
jgi:hypothetical protein